MSANHCPDYAACEVHVNGRKILISYDAYEAFFEKSHDEIRKLYEAAAPPEKA